MYITVTLWCGVGLVDRQSDQEWTEILIMDPDTISRFIKCAAQEKLTLNVNR